MSKEITIKSYIGKTQFDIESGVIWGEKNGKLQMVAEVRGWGAIQNMFKFPKDAEVFQDAVGNFIADAINEKIERDFK